MEQNKQIFYKIGKQSMSNFYIVDDSDNKNITQYKKIKQIGSGTFSKVYKCQNT